MGNFKNSDNALLEGQAVVGHFDLPEKYREPRYMRNFGYACYRLSFYAKQSQEQDFVDCREERALNRNESKLTTTRIIVEYDYLASWDGLKDMYGKPIIDVVYFVLKEIETNENYYM